MISPWINGAGGGPNPVTSVLVRDRREDVERRRGSHVKAEAGVTQPQAKESLELPTLGEVRKRMSPGAPGREEGRHRRRARVVRTENSRCHHVERTLC